MFQLTRVKPPRLLFDFLEAHIGTSDEFRFVVCNTHGKVIGLLLNLELSCKLFELKDVRSVSHH